MVGPGIDIYRETDHRYLKVHLDYIDRVLGESAVHTLAENKKKNLMVVCVQIIDIYKETDHGYWQKTKNTYGCMCPNYRYL